MDAEDEAVVERDDERLREDDTRSVVAVVELNLGAAAVAGRAHGRDHDRSSRRQVRGTTAARQRRINSCNH